MASEVRRDYVIVGAGTSGITLGYLMEKYGKDVVVLEAGEDKDDDPNIHNLKSFYGLEAHYRNEYFWLENGRPNPRLASDGNHYSGGRLWGGCSSINGIDVPVVDDLHTVNGPALSVRSQHFVNLSNKKRVSTSVSLLKKRKSNLDIRSQATVLNVLFEGKKAVGVRYIHRGETKTIFANKKIIVCAGPRSSCILMHSGIGDAKHLSELGIPITHENPEVGQNLTNHLLLLTKMSVPPQDNKDIAEALHFKGLTGVTTFPDIKRGDLSDIDFEITTLSLTPGEALLACFFVNPDSRGHIEICSSDPLHPIVVETNYLSAPEDTAKLERALEVVEKVTDRLSASHKGYKRVSDLSDKTAYIKNNVAHVHHWTGTCRIGKVLDEHLNVVGVENLVVADTSSIPEIVRGHTYAPALLVAAATFVELTGIKDWDF
jgi:choline dehydrogenase